MRNTPPASPSDNMSSKRRQVLRLKNTRMALLTGYTQRGQAMPLGIAAILVGMLGAFVLFNTGQVAVNKQRLSDAADSAAYSGMVWQARALNYQAYTNRAMIANDVTVGQAVSLNSWSTYASVATGNIATVLETVPVINVIADILAQAFAAVNAVVIPVSQAMVAGMEIINSVIELSQEAMFGSAFLATPDIVHQVAKASDASFDEVSAYAAAGLVANLTDWQSFTEKYEQSDIDAMRERTDLVSQSRDDFATGRRWHFLEKLWFFAGSPFLQWRVYYDGQTRLLMSNDENGEPNWEWVAKDAVSLHIKTYRFKRFRLRKRIDQAPIGWASAYANSDSSETKTIDENDDNCTDYSTYNASSCDFLAKNATAEDWANAGYRFSPTAPDPGPNGVDFYNGVNAFRSLSQSVLDEGASDDPVLRLRTEISMDVGQSGSSNDWVYGDEPFATEMVSAGDKMSSISIAEVYYRHPKAYKTGNNAIAMQRANGYNPYWDVRLAPVELEERLAALAARDGFVGGSSSSSTPGSEQLENYGGSDDGIEVDPAGNVSELGEYVGTLAEQMGLDETASELAMDQLNRIPGVDDFSADQLALLSQDYALDTIKDQIEDQLKDALEDALRTMWDRSDGLGTGITTDDIDNAIQEGEDFAQEAEDLAGRMEAIQEAVADDFEEALLAEVPPFEAEIERIRELLGPLYIERNDLLADINGRDSAGDGPVAEYNAVLATIDSHIADMRTAGEELRALVTDTVIESMERHGAEFFTDGITGEFRDYVEGDIQDIISDYLALSEEERLNADTDGTLPWEQEDEDDDAEPLDDNYDEENYGNFED